jgi:hypothetical protein
MGAAAGYTSQYGYELYDTAGTTEDDTYAATGGYGYTIEMGPPGGNFHMPYQVGVIDEWTGANPHSANRGGLREALLIAAEAAAAPADHAILRGTAPAGDTLRVTRSFQTRTSPYCQKGIEPVLNIGLPVICLTGQKPPIVLDDTLRASTVVPASGTYEWHVNPSTQPFVAAGGGVEAYQLQCLSPAGATLETRTVTIARGQDVTLNLGCGGARATTTLGDGTKLPASPGDRSGGAIGPAPSVDGVRAALSTVAGRKRAKPKTVSAAKGRKFAACTRRATRGSAAKARAKQRACERRYGI